MRRAIPSPNSRTIKSAVMARFPWEGKSSMNRPTSVSPASSLGRKLSCKAAIAKRIGTTNHGSFGVGTLVVPIRGNRAALLRLHGTKNWNIAYLGLRRNYDETSIYFGRERNQLG